MRSARNYLLISLLIIGALFVVRTSLPVSLKSDEAFARAQVEVCKSGSTVAEKEICYQKEVPKLMDQGLSMERTFAITQRILDLDTQYESCHVLAHLITAKEVAQDPSKWKDVVRRSPTGFCGTGALHGAFQERFRVESFPDASVETLRGILAGVCDPRDGWNPTQLDRSSCMHGMGHLFIYVTEANVQKSVKLCTELAKLPDWDFRQTCYEGVFMQVNQPLDAEDEVLTRNIAESIKNPRKFCGQFAPGLVRDTCIKESWPQDIRSVTTSDGFEALCKQTSRDYVHYCASANIFAVIETLHYDLPKIKELCRGMKDQDFKDMCWARTAVKYIWADSRDAGKAVGVCTDAPTESQSVCWEHLIQYAEQGWQSGSSEAKALCKSVPESLRSPCAQRTHTTL